MKRNMQLHKKMPIAEFYIKHMPKGKRSKDFENQINKLLRFRSNVLLENITEWFVIDYYHFMVRVLCNSETSAKTSLNYFKMLYNNALLCGFLELGKYPFKFLDYHFTKKIPEKLKVYVPKFT